MTQHNSSFTTSETYTDSAPLEPSQLHDWIAPLPWWHVTTSSWGLPWQLHVYGLAVCYGLLPLASAGTYLKFRPRAKRLGVVLLLLTFVSLVGCLRLTFCLTRPYDFKDTLLGALSRLLLHVAYPFLCGAYALIQVALVKLTRLPIGSRRFRTPFAVLLSVAGCVVCSVAAHGVVLFHRHLHVILMLDNVVFVTWLLYLCVKFTCSGFLLTQFALDAQVARKCFLETRDRRRNREHPSAASSAGCLDFLCGVIVKRHHAQSCRHCNSSRSSSINNNKRDTRSSYGLCPAGEQTQSWLSSGPPSDVWDMSVECSSPESEFCYQDCGLSHETLTDESIHKTQRRCCPKRTRALCRPVEYYNSKRSFHGSSSADGPFFRNEPAITNSLNEQEGENCNRKEIFKIQSDLTEQMILLKKSPVRRQLGTRRKSLDSDSSEPNESENSSEICHMHHLTDVLSEELHSQKNVLLCACALSYRRCLNVSGSESCNKTEDFCANTSGCEVGEMKKVFASKDFVKPRKEYEEKLGKRTQPQGMKSPGKNSTVTDGKKTQTARQMRNKNKTSGANAFYLNERRDKSVPKEKETDTVKKQLIPQDPAGTDRRTVRKSKGFWKISKDKRMTSTQAFDQDSHQAHPPLWKCHGSNNKDQKSVRVAVKDSNMRHQAHDRDVLLRIWRMFARRWREHDSSSQGPPLQYLAFGGKLCRKFAPDAKSATSEEDEEDENDSSSCAGDAGYLADNEHTQSPLISTRNETTQASSRSVETSRIHKFRGQIDFFGGNSARKAAFQEDPGKKEKSETCAKHTFRPLSASRLVSHPPCLAHSETSFTLVPTLDSPVNSRCQRGFGAVVATSRPSPSSAQPAEGFTREGEIVESDLRDPHEPRAADFNGRVAAESLDSLELCWTVQPRALPLGPNEEHHGRPIKPSEAYRRSPACADLFRIRQAAMLRRSVQGMYVLTFVNLFACLLNLYSIFGRYGALWSWSTTVAPEPWSWLAFQTLLRLTEVTMSYLTLAIVFNILRHQKRRWK